MHDLTSTDFDFRTATASGGSSGGCVAVAVNLPGVVAIRDSVHPERGHHETTPADFTAFQDALLNGSIQY